MELAPTEFLSLSEEKWSIGIRTILGRRWKNATSLRRRSVHLVSMKKYIFSFGSAGERNSKTSGCNAAHQANMLHSCRKLCRYDVWESEENIILVFLAFHVQGWESLKSKDMRGKEQRLLFFRVALRAILTLVSNGIVQSCIPRHGHETNACAIFRNDFFHCNEKCGIHKNFLPSMENKSFIWKGEIGQLFIKGMNNITAYFSNQKKQC